MSAVIPFDRSRAPRVRTGSAALLLTASLVAGNVVAAEPVERDNTTAQVERDAQREIQRAQAESDRAQSTADRERERADRERDRAQSDRDARLEDAKRRLEKAAAEVAALSSNIASETMQTWAVGPRRSIIGVQVEAPASGPGARVSEVSPGGAAEAAGMKVGDVILSVNDNIIKDGPREVVRLLRQAEPDTKLRIRVLRDGKQQKWLDVTPRAFDSQAFAFSRMPDMKFDFDFDQLPFGPFGPNAVGSGLGGMQLTSLTPQLARYFGADKGLLVLRAPKDELYKLQDGDVILNIDGRVPTSASHVTRILRSYQPGETLTMRIMRDRKPMELQITLPAQEGRSRATRAAWFDRDSTPL